MDQWSDLPVDLLIRIHQHLHYDIDKIRFRFVCTHWQSNFHERSPWLLLPYKSGSLCGLYHPFENKVYELDLPESGEKVFKGSGHGWVVTLQLNGSIKVVNPLTKIGVSLPPRYKFPDVLKYRIDKPGSEYLVKSRDFKGHVYISSLHARNYDIEKIALSCNPSSNDFRAVALYRGIRLAYCKKGVNKWYDLVDPDDPSPRYKDITFWDGKLYVMTRGGDLMICDDIVSCPKLRMLVPRPPEYEDFEYEDVHLVNSCNGLMAVRRFENHRKIQIGDSIRGLDSKFDFKVFKLDMRSASWTHGEGLGRETLFMGLGTQFGISFCNVGENIENKIYFINDNLDTIEDRFDNRIFSFEGKNITPLEVGYECNPPMIWPLPIWVMLNPC